MNANEKTGIPDDPSDVAIGVWENEGGSLARAEMNGHYGRRVEPNRSWTIYHVFTGVPATMGNRSMVGLTETDATATMMRLNKHNLERRKTVRSTPTPATCL